MANPPPRFPADATMFFCIGAQKAGTSWLYDLLSQSPDCHFSPNKELHYFDVISGIDTGALDMRLQILNDMMGKIEVRDGALVRRPLVVIRDLADLLTIYSGGGKGPGRHAPYLAYLLRGRRRIQKVVCDITPSYATLGREQFTDMASIGKARFLFILREPVSRMWSQIRMATDARKLPPEEFAGACADHARKLLDSGRLPRLARADYARTIAELEAVVPAERIKYVFYETLFRQESVDGICDFLDIAPLSASTTERVNEGRSLPIPAEIAAAFRKELAAQYDFAARRFGADLPEAWQRDWSA